MTSAFTLPLARSAPMTEPFDDLQHAVQRARQHLAFRALPASLILSVGLAAVIALVLFLRTQSKAPLWWCGAFLTIAAIRAVVLHRFNQQAHKAFDPDPWHRLFLLTTLAAGAAWGSISVFLFPLEAILQLLLAFTLAGTTAAAATSLSAERTAAIGFVALSIVPLAIRLLLATEQATIAMGVMVLLFLALVIGSISRFHAQINRMIMAQLVADDQRRQLQAARTQMQRLSDRMHIATQAAKAGVWEWTVATGEQEWDAQVHRMYCIDPDSGPSSYESWRSRVHPQDLASTEATLREALVRQNEFTTEFRVVWPDGTERSIKMSCMVQRDEERRATHVIGMNWDITDLRRVDRMKNEFVSMVSHELRTPLTSIRGALGLVTSGSADAITDKTRKLLQLASRNAERLAVLINDLLDIEKIESGKLRVDMTRQPLQSLLDQAAVANSTYASIHGVNLSLRTTVTCEVDVDANRLVQVMTNLLSNAVKFSPRGGTVHVDAREIGMKVRVEVHDQGPGISPEFQTKIFGKFCQGDSSDARLKGGSGLGLSISRGLIGQMHGTIDFTTRPGAGTTFFFELPLCDVPDDIPMDHTTVILPPR